jgi:hypothetical protein
MARKEKSEAEEKGCGCGCACGEDEGFVRHCMGCKWCRSIALLLVIAGAVVWYSKQDESKKRFLKHLGRQVPYLPARYYA